ncbi:anti-phage protein KwaB [Acinetobacter sp. WCHAc060042]|uniref:anti-phage protein KwaB n=1 Tax=Acinetobacter sp. WCHAc060042 TaxID=2213016 RepID=UPI000DA67BE5|nr:anti-phage protein KwaB [Acinetobacter sp. WCHAc060042]
MNRNELEVEVNEILCDVGAVACLYAVILKEDTYIIKKVDIAASLQDDIKKLFETSLRSSNIFNDDVVLKQLSDCDERRNVICEVDVELGAPFDLISSLDKTDGDFEVFNPSKEIEHLKAFLIDIGTQEKQLLIYKHIYPLEIMKKSRFAVVFNSNIMEKFTDQLLTISPSFQMVRTNEKTFVLDIPFIEKNAKFQQVTKEKATQACEVISKVEWLANAVAFEELVDDMSFARKLSRISADSPVIKKNIPSEKILTFCKNFPSVKGKIRFNDDDTKILLDTKVSKNIIIKIFLDDMLTSELTESHYESLAKDSVD